ncbi:uncharacterized protein [Nicotiana tomentosiformis]|uniref:uncharacterized protein n=1 Tax=Nicotiana tomentosiformis TaxID=4098 RepID=UPI00388C5606
MDFPRHGRGAAQHGSQAVIQIPIITLPAPPARGGAQAVRGRPRGRGQSGGDQTRCYAFLGRPEVEAYNAVITGICSVFHRDASVLFDPGSTYSYVSSYFASYLGLPNSSLDIPIHVSTSVCDSIMVNHVYWSCLVTIGGFETSVDILLLSMVDFNVILGMDRLYQYHAILNCHAKTVMLSMPGLPSLEWKGSLGYTFSRVV